MTRRARTGRRMIAAGVIAAMALASGWNAAAKDKTPGAEADVLLAAMDDELTRSIKKLRVKDLKRPYFIEYAVDDARHLHLNARFGAVTNVNEHDKRTMRIGVRVGDYDFDNSAFVSGRWGWGGQGHGRAPVLDDHYAALRRDFWLATDEEYKSALEDFSDKEAALKNRVQTEDLPDFSREKPFEAILPRTEIHYNRGNIERLVRELSAEFRRYPALHESNVTLNLESTQKYYVNTEGTRVRQPQRYIAVQADAHTQAPDGMQLYNYVAWYGVTVEDLPPRAEMLAGVRRIAEELTQMRTAPVLDDYLGPVLMMEDATVEVFARVFAQALSGERPPVYADDNQARRARASKYSARINRRVLPRFLNAVDDPTLAAYNGKPTLGHYVADDEGVPARRTVLVEEGILKTLLMTRRPHKKIAHSNGHARWNGRTDPQSTISNLIVTATAGKPVEELKQEMMDLCRDQELPFGLIIKRTQGSVQQPLLVYTVDAKTGEETLVRGLILEELPVLTLKDIIAAGDTPFVSEGPINGVPVTVAAPPVLFEELELKKSRAPQPQPVVLAHPYFAK